MNQLANALISEHHPHLEEAKILILFREEATKYRGKVRLGKASKMTAQEKAIAGEHYDFKIRLAYDYWSMRSHEWRRALLDHELCHCSGSPSDGWEMRTHDLEEFAEVVERHGLWDDDVEHFFQRTNQLNLFEGRSTQERLAQDASTPEN